MLLLAIFFMGLQLGATACAISCLPVMTPILLLNSEDKSGSLRVLYLYFGGKILAYTFISSLSFFGGSVFKTLLNPIYFTKLSGIFLILLGFYLLFSSFKQNKSCTSSCHPSLKYGYFGVGFLSSFSFCLPLASLITTSATASSFGSSVLFGIAFGFGVVIVPFLFFYFFIFKITTEVLSELSNYKKHIEIFSASLLIGVGVLIFLEILKL